MSGVVDEQLAPGGAPLIVATKLVRPPVRAQHRTVALWMLNTMAVREIGADDSRLFRADGWLRARAPVRRSRR